MNKVLWLLIGLCLVGEINGQAVDLAKHHEKQLILPINRSISIVEKTGLELDAQEGNGLAVLDSIWFETGTIKIELKGKNEPGSSFVGLAFNIENDSTYEAIYFRPFNFESSEEIRRSHMVQYICHPTYTWRMLREERTNIFENEIKLPPDPDDWFEVSIMVTDTKVVVHVEGNEEPVLVVNRLTEFSKNRIGLWTGTGSSGRFRSLEIY